MISDIILSIFAFYFYFIHRNNNKQWSYFFLLIGLSALVGGIYHGYNEIGEQYRFLSWGFLSASLIFAINAVYHQLINFWLKSLVLLKSILLLTLSIYYSNFMFMVFDTLLSLLVFIVIGNLIFIKSLSKYISYGILISLSSVFFIVFQVNSDSQYLTYNDIGHYITIITLGFISKGAKEDFKKDNLEINKA